MASEATGIKTGMAIQVNMHMDIRVKEVARFKSKVIFIVSLLASLKGHCPLVHDTMGVRAQDRRTRVYNST